MSDQEVIHPIEPISNISQVPDMSQKSIPKKTVIIILSFITIFGIVTGSMIAYLEPQKSTTGSAQVVTNDSTGKLQSAGVIDKKTFTDSAEGVLKEGGFEGEGSHHLERGAKDQTAYLTSSTVDMSPFVGKKVKVWGQTHTSERVGWFMDIGYLEVVK